MTRLDRRTRAYIDAEIETIVQLEAPTPVVAPPPVTPPVAITKRTKNVSALSGSSPWPHGFGSALGLSMNQYNLELRAYDGTNALVGGIGFSKVDTDTITVTVDPTAAPFSGSLFLEVTPL